MDTAQAQAFAHVLDGFTGFFEWAYQVPLRPEHREALKAEVLRGWSNPDESTRQLVTYVLGLQAIVAAKRPAEHGAYRAQAQQIFRRAFTNLEPNDRGRALSLLHQVLEQLQPGCTGALPQPVGTAPVPSPMPVPLAPPAALAYFHSQATAIPGAAPVPAPPAHPAAPQPVHPVAPRPVHPATAQPGYAVAALPAAPGASSLPMDHQILMDAQIRQQNIMRDKKLWDMQHETIMSIWR